VLHSPLLSYTAFYSILISRTFALDTRKPNQDSFSISDKKYCGIDNHALLSVFDGHGPDGHSCAWFVKENLHNLFEKYYKQVHAKTTKSSFHGSLPSGKPEEWPVTLMTPELYQDAAIMAHISCNEELRASKKVNDLLSGTTSISVGFHQDFMVTMNVGDSRAILGYLDDNGNMISKHLSHDQTPYRKDERERVKECGAMIRSLDQLDGLEPLHENWSDNLGNVIDEDGDPPRLWHRDGEYPGCAFTRSIGDSLAESIGVFAEPELNVKKIADKDKIVVIASDGVFEFIPSQAIIEMCAKYDNPLDACEHVVSTAYTEWLKRETRTDDITMICVFLDEIVTDDASNGDTK